MYYKKILEGVVDIINTTEKSDIGFANICSYIGENCPELKESEDEKIRKNIIAIFKGEIPYTSEEDAKRYIAWLEKQGEQKPADKVEPKFNNGQWIVWQDKCYKVNYNGCGYELVDQNGLSTSLEYGTIDEKAHLWTIQDAKDGDVLVSDYEGGFCITILKSVVSGNEIEMYCHLVNSELFIAQSGFSNATWHPATKEQRDALEKAIADAGYTFDFDKKELKKIEQNLTNSTKTCKDEKKPIDIDIDKMVDDYANNKERGNEEFGKPVNCMIRAYRQGLNDAIGKVIWNYAWSEEDDYNLQCMIAKVTSDIQKGNVGRNNELIDWLKSLKDRVQSKPKWKPSDEQMVALDGICSYIRNKADWEISQDTVSDLYKLSEQLKKLTEE